MREIKDAIGELLAIVKRLQVRYPNKRFTLDGRLVGDIGEVLAADKYNIDLNVGLTKYYDALSKDGKKIQIKATMKDSLTYPADHVPDYYLGIKIRSDGQIEEIYNGPGKIIAEYLKNRKKPKNNLHNISLTRLQGLNGQVSNNQRIKLRE